MAIDIETAKRFILLWTEKRTYAKPIFRWCEASEAIALWQDKIILRPTIEEMARDFNCTPKEAYHAAMELRSMGVRLAEKENEARYAPKEKAEFNWVRFGELLIKTRRPSIVCEAFDLTDDQFIRLTEILTRCGVRIPPLQLEKDIPEWLEKRMQLALNPARFTPEEKRTIRSRYNRFKNMPPLSRPKGKKRGYLSGGSVYNPRGQYKRGKRGIRRPSASERAFLAGMYA